MTDEQKHFEVYQWGVPIAIESPTGARNKILSPAMAQIYSGTVAGIRGVSGEQGLGGVLVSRGIKHGEEGPNSYIAGSCVEYTPQGAARHGSNYQINLHQGSILAASRKLFQAGLGTEYGPSPIDRYKGLVKQVSKETTEHEVQHYNDMVAGVAEEELEPRARALEDLLSLFARP